MNKETIDNFLKIKKQVDTRAEEVYDLLVKLKEFDPGWKDYLVRIEYDEDGCVNYTTGASYMNEWCENYFSCDIEYLSMSDDEITDIINKKNEKIRKEREELERKECGKREKDEYSLYEKLKKKFEKEGEA
jgi:hypothetical protein